jgi:omega-6 fatty acid desaturase (delta-12 desaturase)
MTQVNNSIQKKWREAVKNYQYPDIRRSIWQLMNTSILYIVLWIMMVFSLDYPYWITFILTILAGGMFARFFIIFHDCGHGSFFKTSKANHWVGSILGVLVFTPYFYWRQSHAIHHATAGNLDKRGDGDVWTMTVDEFLGSTPWQRFKYKIYRNPLIMFGIGPLLIFLITHRIPTKSFRKRERNSIHWTNLFLVVYIILMSWLIGIKQFVLIQLPIIWIASTIGVWLFYVQHQFEGVYWDRTETWDFVRAGLEGSSFYQLPKVLQWFTGNIGFHHIHHLSPKIPNYNLEPCHNSNPIFQVRSVKLLDSLKSLKLRLWDEKRGRLVGYKSMKKNAQTANGPNL